MFSSFFSRSPLWGPTPFRYSIGFDNMLEDELIKIISTKVIGQVVINRFGKRFPQEIYL